MAKKKKKKKEFESNTKIRIELILLLYQMNNLHVIVHGDLAGLLGPMLKILCG